VLDGVDDSRILSRYALLERLTGEIHTEDGLNTI